MEPGIRYAHTNLIANDWQRLQDFYCQVFACEPVSSERERVGSGRCPARRNTRNPTTAMPSDTNKIGRAHV